MAVCVLGCKQEGEAKAIAVILKVLTIRKPKPNQVDWPGMLKLEWEYSELVLQLIVM